jgi:signal transduction histidine kinase/ligand-binding sensor domain-containing protein/DNA-binding response OmpR family regulator
MNYFSKFIINLLIFLTIISSGNLLATIHGFERALPGNNSEATIYSIVQDKQGFIWFATRDGLWKFDGHTTREYRYDPGDTTSISSSYIRSMTLDRDGTLWIGTVGGGLNRYLEEYDQFRRYMHHPDNPATLSHNDVLHIYEDRAGVLWVSTEDGLNQMDKESETFRRYYLEENPLPGLHNRAVLSCMEDADGSFWVGTFFRGLFKFDRTNGSYTHVDLGRFYQNENPQRIYNIWSMMQDSKGNLWVGTHRQGLFRYNPKTDTADHFSTTSSKRQQRISNNIIYTLMEDRQGRIWMGTDRGLNIYEQGEMSMYFSSYEDPTSISTNGIWALMQDAAGTVWLGGWEGQPDKYDERSRRFINRMSQGVFPPTPLHYNVILRDSRDRLLVGTNSGLLVVNNFSSFGRDSRISVTESQQRFLNGNYISTIIEDSFGDIWVGSSQGIWRFNTDPSRATRYTASNPVSEKGLAANFISSIIEDSRKTIWVGTQNGLHQYQRHDNTFRQFHSTPFVAGTLSHRYVTYVYEDKTGSIWVGTPNGLNKLNLSTGTFSYYNHIHGNPTTLANGVINIIYHDSRGLLWVGTTAGLSCASDFSGRFRNFTVDQGLPGNNVAAIYEDKAGYLWVSTNQGISRLKVEIESQDHKYNINTLQVSFWNFTRGDGLPDTSFKRSSVASFNNGEVMFGGTFGISSFFPDSVKPNPFIPQVIFTDLRILNRSVKPQAGSKLLDRHISMVKEITLTHKQSVITLDFQALNFTNSENNQYAYLLKGFDKEWIHAGNRRSATYTNLNQGKYTFMVKASNNDGIWNEQPTLVNITILPPPWKTLPAFFFYVVILSATVFGFAQLTLAKQKAEGKLKIEHMEMEKIIELNYFKSIFFTNISHEFRTPLTLIIGPLSDIMKNTSLNDQVKGQVKLIQKNALRLLRLINQLLDMSKIEAGHIKLMVSKSDIVEFTSSVYDAFRIKAERDNITYRFYTSHDEIEGYFDSDKLEKILYNLLSNAFKYTPAGGRIDVLLFQKYDEQQRKFIELIVHDTGKGIVPEKQKKIFERYFTSGGSQHPWQSSTGIGLSLANQLALVHKGKITLESAEGKGSRFIVNLPVSQQAFSAEEIIQDNTIISNQLEQVKMMIDYESSTIQPILNTDNNQPIALLVEDNRDVRDYLNERLSEQYRVITAENGQEGFEKAVENIPDVIVSDVMMPVMDGFELCRTLKADERTSHIPVILLTARAEDESRVEGYEMGADGFIPKPFQMARLEARMRNLIESRNKLRQIFGKRLTMEPSEVSMNSIDETFIKKAIDVIEKYISEPELNVEMLCSKLGMSRSQAFRKFKAITDLSPVEFIRMIRVKRSAQLLTQRVGNISEIAYMVGFSDLDYFRKCFKEQFGVTPSKYIEVMPDGETEVKING